jgi:hypothetical protein
MSSTKVNKNSENKRHFRVIELEGKPVSFGEGKITLKSSPADAARKLLSSIAHKKGLDGMKKLNIGKIKFKIQEFTQGSKKKVYGPYVGYFHKYTVEELKKTIFKDEKRVVPKMKPIVKLNKSTNNKTNKSTNNKTNNSKNNKTNKSTNNKMNMTINNIKNKK